MIKKNLKTILDNIPIQYHSTDKSLNLIVSGIQFDSREIEDGQIFVALEGGNVDGHLFIESAIKKGSAAVVGSQPVERWEGLSVPYLQFEDTRTGWLTYLPVIMTILLVRWS